MSQDSERRTADDRPPMDRLVALLAGHLAGCRWGRWPGADGLTLAEVVRTRYPAAAAAGYVPGLQELARRHPDLAAAIAALFPAPAGPSAGAVTPPASEGA
jgi:hypothetical protein